MGNVNQDGLPCLNSSMSWFMVVGSASGLSEQWMPFTTPDTDLMGQ